MRTEAAHSFWRRAVAQSPSSPVNTTTATATPTVATHDSIPAHKQSPTLPPEAAAGLFFCVFVFFFPAPAPLPLLFFGVRTGPSSSSTRTKAAFFDDRAFFRGAFALDNLGSFDCLDFPPPLPARLTPSATVVLMGVATVSDCGSQHARWPLGL